MRVKETYTTKETGEICGVDLTTVINWVKKGKLKAYKTAGGHRRITLKDLKKFMRDYSIPVPYELKSSFSNTLLICENDINIYMQLRNSMNKKKINMVQAKNEVEVGYLLAVHQPEIVMIDLWNLLNTDCSIIDQVKTLLPSATVIAIPGKAAAADEQNARKSGAEFTVEHSESMPERVADIIKRLV